MTTWHVPSAADDMSPKETRPLFPTTRAVVLATPCSRTTYRRRSGVADLFARQRGNFSLMLLCSLQRSGLRTQIVIEPCP